MTGTENRSRRETERKRLQELKSRQPASDSATEPGVLLSDAIRKYAHWFDLIIPFDEKNLKPANYKLTVGDQYAINGRIQSLEDAPGKNELVIDPFAVAIIQTRETISMPRFLIGRWNIQVRRAYQGLVWVGGPQVDAGYVGHLFCPIYNLSDKTVVLRWGESIAVIDFVKTTDFHDGKSLEYENGKLPENILFEDYNPQELVSGLVTHAQSKIKHFEDESRELRANMNATQNRIDSFVLLTFGAVSVLFAALTIFVTRGDTSTFWNLSVFLISGLAIFLSMSAWLKSRTEARFFGWVLETAVIVTLVLAIVSQIYSTRSQQMEINNLKRQVNQLSVTHQDQPTSSTGSPTTPPQAK